MDFLEAVKIVLDHEGVDSNHPDDKGGLTRFGISEKSYPNLDVSNLSKDDAIFLYERDFWNKLMVQHLPPPLRLMVFDCAVNQGAARSAMFLQRALGITADGIVGDITISAVRNKDVFKIVDSMARQRMTSYTRHPKWSVFGAGWSMRLMDITLRCLV
jgi:lysozyme family protein